MSNIRERILHKAPEGVNLYYQQYNKNVKMLFSDTCIYDFFNRNQLF